jgi:tripartite-type tricarboxylate transporter receptor subunit TctC
VTTAKRVPGVDLPTIAEAGLPGYETTTWGGVLAPAGTPRTSSRSSTPNSTKASRNPTSRRRSTMRASKVAGGTPQQFADFLQAEMKKWAKVAKDANIQPE